MQKNALLNSHINLLERNGISISILDNDTIKNALNSIKKRDGVIISDNYKCSLLRTIKSLNKNVSISPATLHLKRNRNKNTYIEIKQIQYVSNVIKYAYKFDVKNNPSEEVSLIDTIIAILIVTSTNITLRNLYELKFIDLQNLISNDRIIINEQIILKAPIFNLASKKILELIQYRITFFTKQKFVTKSTVTKNYVITCTKDRINKKMKILTYTLNFNDNNDLNNESYTKEYLGLQAIRSINKDTIYNIVQNS